MSQTIIEKLPAYRLDEAKRALEKAHARLVRAAAKAGQEPPAAPSLQVVARHVYSRCQHCKITVEGITPPASHVCPREDYQIVTAGTWASIELLDLELTAERPVLAGWVFLAVVEPLDGGNLIRQVPGADVGEGELLPWRQGKISCDHCGTIRKRTETFIVRADGSDPTIAEGTYKQVGRNCLEPFLGSKSAATIIAQLTWGDIVRAAGDDGDGGWGGGTAAEVFDPKVLLAQTAAVIRLDGWVSRSQARASDDVSATADKVLYLLTPPFRDPNGNWRRERARCAPTPQDLAHGAKALQWAQGLVASTDYECNLSLVARQEHVKRSHVGILASAVSAYFRVLGQEIERRQIAVVADVRPSTHVGEIGQRLDLELEVQRVITKDTDYGALHIISMRDRANNLIVWMTGSATATPGDRLHVRGTVKKHNEYNAEQQTVLTRCRASVIDPDHPQPAPAPTAKRVRKSKKIAARLDDVLDAGGRVTEATAP
jgi:hypothetical protein